MNERLSQAVAAVSGRLADMLAASFPRAEGAVAQGCAFLRAISESAPEPAGGADRLARLASRLSLSEIEIDLVVLAGMAEEHEGFAAVFRTLHPRGESRPTAGLAAQLFAIDAPRRPWFRDVLETGPLARFGVLRTSGDGPFFDHALELGDLLWPVLHGSEGWPAAIARWEGPVSATGLEEWLSLAPVARGCRALANGEPCTILVTAESEDLAFERGRVLVEAAKRNAAALAALPDAEGRRLLEAHCLARGAVPVLRVPAPEGPAGAPAPDFDGYPDTAVLCCREGSAVMRKTRPIIPVAAERMTVGARRRMWQAVLSGLPAEFYRQAAIFSLESAAASELAADLRCVGRLEERPATFADLAAGLRARASVTHTAGLKLIHPRAQWDDLVLPRDREEQLREAVARLTHQERVFDDWGFLKNRPGARGVRMLFSGPSGTGKTYAAEVLANALSSDLLLVDISRVVSKWIGETEKNLAAVFDAAERSQAVCFFDEADALFGRRTEVSDAHDRYANLETAYLLSRLERFEGLAILATNLRHNIDPAFLRRMEFVVDFDEPDREERFRIWRCHIPNERLLAEDVNLFELAALYPVVGGFIKNAALSAAFLAAADGGRIMRHHFLRAIRREYQKSGRPFPGLPAGVEL